MDERLYLVVCVLGFLRRRGGRYLVAVVLVFVVVAGAYFYYIQGPREPSGVLDLTVSGSISVNGMPFTLAGQGSVDLETGKYSIRFSSNELFSSTSLCPLESTLATWIPKIALKFVVPERKSLQGTDLYNLADKNLLIEVTGFPKRDPMSGLNRFFSRIGITGDARTVKLDISGAINTVKEQCRNLESEGGTFGHSVIRLGIRPIVESGHFVGGSFVGIGRVDFDKTEGDPNALGFSDFWNLDGAFHVERQPSVTPSPIASVDLGYIERATPSLTGTITNFRGTTVPMRAVITISGTAMRDGIIHQHIAVSNARGGGPFLAHMDIPVKEGDSPAQVAARIADAINRSPAGFQGGGHMLAVQGGSGVGESKPDTMSPRVAFCLTRDGVRCVSPDDSVAASLFSQVMTQAFGDAGFHADSNSGLVETFGVLGEPPLVGWLTPFKVVFFADNPATNRRAAGGELTVQSNTCTTTNGADCDAGTIKRSAAVTVKTTEGETAVEIARAVVGALEQLGTDCIQRVGPIVYMDAGLEMPSTLTVQSLDLGIGMMAAAADLPTLNEPH